MEDTILMPKRSATDAAAGWIVGIILIIAIIIGAAMLYRSGTFEATPNDGANINVTIPSATELNNTLEPAL